MVIDPGTGCYYADKRLREWLASHQAHNGPCPVSLDFPKRLGPFLWSEHHGEPTLKGRDDPAVAELALPGCKASRSVTLTDGGRCWHVDDFVRTPEDRGVEFTVRWQFAPGAWVKRLGERQFAVHRGDLSIVVQVTENWATVELVEPAPSEDESLLTSAPAGSLEGIVSPAFRKICRAPFLKLTAAASDKPCVFRTSFLASPPP